MGLSFSSEVSTWRAPTFLFVKLPVLCSSSQVHLSWSHSKSTLTTTKHSIFPAGSTVVPLSHYVCQTSCLAFFFCLKFVICDPEVGSSALTTHNPSQVSLSHWNQFSWFTLLCLLQSPNHAQVRECHFWFVAMVTKRTWLVGVVVVLGQWIRRMLTLSSLWPANIL